MEREPDLTIRLERDEMTTCDHNCFECKFDDCVCPDDELSQLEESDARLRDAELLRTLCIADIDDEDAQKRKMRADANRRYAAQNREKVRACKRACREKRLDYYREQNMEYYRENRDRINAARREKYRRKKALDRLLAGKDGKE